MDTKFKYFHWAIPKPDQELYALYDLFDNQLLLLGEDFQTIWNLKTLIKSKTLLEIVDFSNQVNQIDGKLDNSVVERWGLNNPPALLFQDVRSMSTVYTEPSQYRERFIIKNVDLLETNYLMDDFKQDLQKQLFFFYYCLHQSYNEYKLNSSSWLFKHLLRSAELGTCYQHVLDLFLDISYFDQHDPESDVLYFLRGENLLYE